MKITSQSGVHHHCITSETYTTPPFVEITIRPKYWPFEPWSKLRTICHGCALPNNWTSANNSTQITIANGTILHSSTFGQIHCKFVAQNHGTLPHCHCPPRQKGRRWRGIRLSDGSCRKICRWDSDEKREFCSVRSKVRDLRGLRVERPLKANRFRKPLDYTSSICRNKQKVASEERNQSSTRHFLFCSEFIDIVDILHRLCVSEPHRSSASLHI